MDNNTMAQNAGAVHAAPQVKHKSEIRRLTIAAMMGTVAFALMYINFVLIKEGFINRTPRGREVTMLAYTHLKKTPKSTQGSLF